MSKVQPNGLIFHGRLKQSGVTFYLRKGKMIMRSADSSAPLRRTRKQFEARQQLSHSCRLWSQLKDAGEPLFPEMPSAYARFRSLMRRTPVVYLPKRSPLHQATLLLPGMAVSDGVLPIVEQWLGEADGIPALLTALPATELRLHDRLLFYTFSQDIVVEQPVVHVTRCELRRLLREPSDDVPFRVVIMPDGCIALVGNVFQDDMKGWAVVHVRGHSCSSQTVLTRCTYYRQYTTDEALKTAAASYGGLTPPKGLTQGKE